MKKDKKVANSDKVIKDKPADKEKQKDSQKKNFSFIFEKNFRTSWTQRIIRLLCLLLPVASAFAGYFAAEPLWKYFFKEKAAGETVPEGLRFALSLILFAITSAIIFFKTRNTNPIMKIRVLMKNN